MRLTWRGLGVPHLPMVPLASSTAKDPLVLTERTSLFPKPMNFHLVAFPEEKPFANSGIIIGNYVIVRLIVHEDFHKDFQAPSVLPETVGDNPGKTYSGTLGEAKAGSLANESLYLGAGLALAVSEAPPPSIYIDGSLTPCSRKRCTRASIWSTCASWP